MCAKIFIAGKIPQVGLDMLKKEHKVEMYDKDVLISPEELRERIKDKDALLSLLSTPVDRETIDRAPKLKIIANYGAGFNNIDYAYAKTKKIPVTNTPHASTEATADLTWGLIIAVARRIVEGDHLCRTKGFNGWAPLFFLGPDVYNKTLGIVGLGNIGQAVAKRAKGFGMKIIYNSRTRKSPEIEKDLNATYVSLEELLKQADFVSLNCSYAPEMKHMISAKQFKLMKPTSYLINVSRGPVVNEQALIQALKNKEIAGAALDVFEFEPKISDELKTMPNVVLTPHIGNASIEARDEMAQIAVNNILAVLKGQPALNPVNM